MLSQGSGGGLLYSSPNPSPEAILVVRVCAQAVRIAIVLSLTLVAAAQNELKALLEQARAAEQAEDYVAAERVYGQALTQAPADPEVLKRLGVLQQTERKFEPSISTFQRVLARDAQYPEANFFLGVSYLGLNRLPEAIQSFERELNTVSPHPRCRYYLGLGLQYSGRIDEAIAQLNRSVADNPKDADALYQLSRMYKNASLQAIDRLKGLDPDSFQLHALMGEIYADQERYPEAIKEYQSALAKRPELPGIHYAVGVAYWAQHLIDAAEKEFIEAWKEDPKDAMTNLYLADIAVRQHRYAGGLQYLRVAQQTQPGMAQVHLLLGKCYQGQKQLEKARDEFLEAIAADPATAQPHYLLAQVYRDLHDAEASAHELEQFEKLAKLEKGSRPEQARLPGDDDK